MTYLNKMTPSHKANTLRMHFFIFYLIVIFLSPYYHHHENSTLAFSHEYGHEYTTTGLYPEEHSQENSFDGNDAASIRDNDQSTAGHIHFKAGYYRVNRHENGKVNIMQRTAFVSTNSILTLTLSSMSDLNDKLRLKYKAISPQTILARSPLIL